MDILSEVLEQSAFTLSFLAETTLQGTVGVALDGRMEAALHAVLEGKLWVEVDECDPVPLNAGMVLVLPVDRPHRVMDRPGRAARPASDLDGVTDAPIGARLSLGTGVTRAVVLSAAFRLRPRLRAGILRLLPQHVLLNASEAAPLWSSVHRVIDEVRGERPGREFALRRTAELLFIESLRSMPDAGALRGLAGAARDPRLQRVLTALHHAPAAAWSMSRLSALAHTSASNLSRIFRTALGVSVHQYLIQLRMERASTLLATTDMPVRFVAKQVGYDSEPAFARTFARTVGMPAARYRRRSKGHG